MTANIDADLSESRRVSVNKNLYSEFPEHDAVSRYLGYQHLFVRTTPSCVVQIITVIVIPCAVDVQLKIATRIECVNPISRPRCAYLWGRRLVAVECDIRVVPDLWIMLQYVIVIVVGCVSRKDPESIISVREPEFEQQRGRARYKSWMHDCNNCVLRVSTGYIITVSRLAHQWSVCVSLFDFSDEVVI